jgi:hypothetical protein
MAKVPCRGGEIGRRARFRSVSPQGCGGSSPLHGTSLTTKLVDLPAGRKARTLQEREPARVWRFESSSGYHSSQALRGLPYRKFFTVGNAAHIL